MEQSKQQKIIEAAILAPSADNSQPFQYKWHSANELHLYIDPSLSGKATDCTFVLSDLALGAVIESVSLSALLVGQTTSVTLLPDLNDAYFVAQVRFAEGESTPSEANITIAQQIPHRCTDRRFPFNGNISAEVISELEKSITSPNCRLTAFNTPVAIKQAISPIYKAEKIRFESEQLHQELFSTVQFHRNNAPSGMNLNVLGIKKFESGGFKLMRKWTTMNWLNKLGASKQIAQKSVVKPISSSPGLLLLSIKSTDRLGILTAGQQLLRLWLKCTELGLSVQLYAAPGVLTIANPDLPATLLKVLAEVKSELSKVVIDNDSALMFLRIGYMPDKPIKTQRRDAASFVKI